MKIGKSESILPVMLAVSVLLIGFISVHGCGVASYDSKKINSVSVTPGSLTVVGGTSQQFTATGHYTDGTTADLSSSVTWTTSDAAKATISASGLATVAIASADTTCTVIARGPEGITGSAMLNIRNLPLATIMVTPANPSVNKGLTLQFAASGVFSNGTTTLTQDVTTSVVWSSSDTAIATINPSTGLATGVAAGTANISASITNAQWGTVTSNSVPLNVSNVALQSLAVTASATKVNVGQTLQLTATGTFVDHSTSDMTSQVAWSASNGKATVSNTGLVTGNSIGSVTITASAGGQTGTINLLVTNPIH